MTSCIKHLLSVYHNQLLMSLPAHISSQLKYIAHWTGNQSITVKSWRPRVLLIRHSFFPITTIHAQRSLQTYMSIGRFTMTTRSFTNNYMTSPTRSQNPSLHIVQSEHLLLSAGIVGRFCQPIIAYCSPALNLNTIWTHKVQFAPNH